MYITGGILLAIAIIVVMWGISIYNQLVRRRTLKEEGWSGIDVQLKRRHDLVGNLVNSVKGYMQHEKTVLEEVTKMRAMSRDANGVAAVASAETGLSQALGRLFAVMENYPDIKANTNVLQLQDSLASLEDEIQKARRYYNATARDLNILVQSFPSNIIANRFGFSSSEFFELENNIERDAPQVTF
ncbi:LemA family protein [Desulfovibrionales bacterium]